MAIRSIVVLVAALAVGVSTAQAQAPSQIRASELIGQSVVGAQGKPLGQVAGLLLDVRKLGVHYVLVKVAQSGASEERFAYPVNALRRDAGELRLNVPAQRLEALPGFDGRRWPDAQMRSGERYVDAARVIGGPLQDPLGNPAGTLVDVALDLQTGRTGHFVVELDDQGPLPLPAHTVRLHADRPPTVHGDRSRRA